MEKVQVFQNEEDLLQWFTCPSIVEEGAEIQTEIAVIVGRSPSGKASFYRNVNDFDPKYNLVSHLKCLQD